MNLRRYFLFGMAILFIAVIFRYPALNQRTMHTDEAVHAFKLADLLEHGNYQYDPHEFHGPALYYLSLPAAWILGQHELSTINETALRMVSVVFGLGIILLVLLTAKLTGWKVALLAALLMALSPPLVFYSRYYIHEILLVFFNLGWAISLLRFSRSKSIAWLVTAGAFAGLMVATKETWIILVASQLLALIAVNYKIVLSKRKSRAIIREVQPIHLVLFFLPALVIASLLFSSFFENPAGLTDALLTYKNYVVRAGQQSDHIQPWYYYGALAFSKTCQGFPLRADSWLLIAGAGGIILAFLTGSRPNQEHDEPMKLTDPASQQRPDHLVVQRYLGLTIVFAAFFFSVIPYKTPWNGLFVYTILAYPAGFLLLSICEMANKRVYRVIGGIITGLIILNLGWQSYADSYINFDNPCNPYVYAHPNNDILILTKEINHIAESAPEGDNMFIEVIVPDHGYWPLPWYLRHFANVGWWDHVQTGANAAPLIVCAPEYVGALSHKLYEMPAPGKRFLYVPLFEDDIRLRPGTIVHVYLRMDYMERYLSWKNALDF